MANHKMLKQCYNCQLVIELKEKLKEMTTSFEVWHYCAMETDKKLKQLEARIRPDHVPLKIIHLNPDWKR